MSNFWRFLGFQVLFVLVLSPIFPAEASKKNAPNKEVYPATTEADDEVISMQPVGVPNQGPSRTDEIELVSPQEKPLLTTEPVTVLRIETPKKGKNTKILTTRTRSVTTTKSVQRKAAPNAQAETIAKLEAKIKDLESQLSAANDRAELLSKSATPSTPTSLANPFDAVPYEQTQPLIIRLKIIEKLIVKYQRAYDYRSMTIAELQKELDVLERAAPASSNASASR